MTRTRLILALAAVTVASPYAYWAAVAQEGRFLFAPPPVLPKDDTPVQGPVESYTSSKAPSKPAPLTNNPKANQTSWPIHGESVGGGPIIVQAGGVSPPPLIINGNGDNTPAPPSFPSAPSVVEPKESPEPALLPTIPPLETKPMAPAPEPAKALIAEPAPTMKPKDEKPPELKLETALPPLDLPPPVAAPPKEAPPRVIVPGPIAAPETKPEVTPPPVVVPSPIAAPETKPEVAPPPGPKAFLPIRTGSSVPPPVSTGSPPSDSSADGALANVQAPSVTIEKRGRAGLRGGEAQNYQIVVRNLGPTAAQPVRIEEDLPANVKIVSADPAPTMQGTTAIWTLPSLAANAEQTLRFTLQAATDTALSHRVSVHISATHQANTITALSPRIDGDALGVELVAPNSIAVGKQVVFQVRVANRSVRPLTGIVLHGDLPAGLSMRVEDEKGVREERSVEGAVDLAIAPGETKTLDMPAQAVKLGRYTVAVKVTADGGLEGSATADIDIVAGGDLQLQQAPTTRMFLGRAGDLRIEVANNTGKPLRNVQVHDRLPDELDFVDASEHGLFQANSRTVYWLLKELPAGKTQTLIARVHGKRAGQHQNVVQARADGVPLTQSAGVIQLEGVADLKLRVIEKDNLLEVGSETVYEIQISNPGNALAGNVRVQAQFPPGLTPKDAQGNTRHALDPHGVVFEPIVSLAPQGQATFRITAVARTTGDQRVRFAISSDQARVPIQQEISTRVVPR